MVTSLALDAPLHERPGFCYLCLFQQEVRPELAASLGRYPVRSLVESAVQSSSARLSSGVFRVTFGTPASVSLSSKFQCHVEPVADGASLVKAKDVVAAMPFGSRFGDGTGVSTVPPEPSAPTSLAVGHATDPTRRRFLVRHSELVNPEGPGTYLRVAIDPLNNTVLAAFTRFATCVVYESLSVLFVPRFAAASHFVTLESAFYGAHESAPTGADAFGMNPGHQVNVLAPTTADGRPNTLRLDCVFADGVAPLARPTPVFGGSPRFAFRYDSNAITGDYVPDTVLYTVFVEARLRLTPN